MKLDRSGVGLVVAFAVLGAESRAQSTALVSQSTSSVQGNLGSAAPAVSADGTTVAFESTATNLVAGDSNGVSDVFVRELGTGLTSRVSIATGGTQGNAASSAPAISSDGRYVAFASTATNLVAGDVNGVSDIFLRDRVSGTTTRLSLTSGGTPGNAASTQPSISDDGRLIAFQSDATNLVPGDSNGVTDVFVRDTLTSQTTRVSIATSGAQAGLASSGPSMSGGGIFVAFQSDANNLVTGDTNGVTDVFVRDMQSSVTSRASVDSSGLQGNLSSIDISISRDGRYAAFTSSATNLVAGDSNGVTDIFLRDRMVGSTTRVSVDSGGTQGNGTSVTPSIGPDARWIAFRSAATNLVTGDVNGSPDVFAHDRVLGDTVLVSLDSGWVQGNSDSSAPSTSDGGRIIAFQSNASNLVIGDGNGASDAIARNMTNAGVTMCEPGLAGVITCPCGNAPSGPRRGCENSSSTGGATLTDTGIPSLLGDTVVFTTTGELPAVTSILLQGSGEVTVGAVFGDGVRCAGGSLKRLYVKTAAGGSVIAPQPGDLSVSARSAALGETITIGQIRVYQVYYRDPVTFACFVGPGASTFNSSSGRRITWLQ